MTVKAALLEIHRACGKNWMVDPIANRAIVGLRAAGYDIEYYAGNGTVWFRAVAPVKP